MDIERLNHVRDSLQNATVQADKDIKRAQSTENFRIAVCGAFSTGKTSLINALSGCQLPTGLLPITKVVTCIRYGSQNAVILENTATGQQQKITQQQAEEIILNHQKKREYGDYRVYYEIPSPFLRMGVEFLDTPGFEDNSNEKLDEITKRAIREADFCIVTFACNSFGGMNERKFLEELQELSHGNYTCVLNCFNRVHSLEAQNDLQERAKYILRDCGNERIGFGRFFMVDSDQNSEEKYLDGLDFWLKDLLKNNASEIRLDAAVSRALSTISPAIDEGNQVFCELMQETQQLMAAKQKELLDQCHKMSTSNGTIPQTLANTRKFFFDRLDQIFTVELRKRLQAVSENNYNDKAENVISRLMLEYSNQLQRTMDKLFPDFNIPDPFEQIKKTKFQWTKRAIWTTKKSFSDYMSDGLSAGVWCWDRYHTNDFIGETIKDTESVTIPAIKHSADEYFSMVEKELLAEECKKLLTEQSPELIIYRKQSESLAEQLIEAELRHSRLLKLASK